MCVQNISTLQIYGKSISKCISESCVFNLKNVFTYTFSLQLPFCMPYLKYLFFQFYCLLHILCRRQTYGFMYFDFFQKTLLEYCAMQTHVVPSIHKNIIAFDRFISLKNFVFFLLSGDPLATTEIVLFMVWCIIPERKDFHVNRTSSIPN